MQSNYLPLMLSLKLQKIKFDQKAKLTDPLLEYFNILDILKVAFYPRFAQDENFGEIVFNAEKS